MFNDAMRRVRPKDVERMMRSLGMQIETLEATEVLIRLSSGDSILIRNPQVSLMKVGSEEIYQVMGASERVSGTTEGYTPSDEDVSLVAAQAGVDLERARRALIETKGDLAEAIIRLKEGKI